MLGSRNALGLRLARVAPRRILRRRAQRASADALRRIAQIAADGGAVVAGPWVSEVGFELLYWRPFLAWARDALGLAPERVLAVTRGGAGVWYRGVASRTADVFDVLGAADLQTWRTRRTAMTRSEKQAYVGDDDRAVLSGLDITEGTALLHPALMYRTFHVAWEWGDDALLRDHLRHERLTPPPIDLPAVIPPAYVAVKLYASDCLPMTDANRAGALAIVRALAARLPVVLLRTGASLDDHVDLLAGVGDIIDAAPLLDLQRNLELQTAIVAGARALVTTYGGFSYLGPYLGVPTVSLYARPTFNPAHLRVMQLAGAALEIEFEFLPRQLDASSPQEIADEVTRT